MTATLAENGAAPAFTLPGSPPVTLASFAGSKLVLYFYPKDDTSGCTKEAIDFNALSKAFAACRHGGPRRLAGLPASHDKFKAKYDLDLRSRPTKRRRCSRPTAYGSRKACMADATWAWSAPPS